MITEDARTLAAVKGLKEKDYGAVGQAMLASHESLRDDYEVGLVRRLIGWWLVAGICASGWWVCAVGVCVSVCHNQPTNSTNLPTK